MSKRYTKKQKQKLLRLPPSVDVVYTQEAEEEWKYMKNKVYDQMSDCKQCGRDPEGCFIHNKEWDRISERRKLMQNDPEYIELYGASACGHYFRNYLELLLHNCTCPKLRHARSNNRSCKPKCTHFFISQQWYSQVFKTYIGGPMMCIKCTYYLNYELMGCV